MEKSLDRQKDVLLYNVSVFLEEKSRNSIWSRGFKGSHMKNNLFNLIIYNRHVKHMLLVLINLWTGKGLKFLSNVMKGP